MGIVSGFLWEGDLPQKESKYTPEFQIGAHDKSVGLMEAIDRTADAYWICHPPGDLEQKLWRNKGVCVKKD